MFISAGNSMDKKRILPILALILIYNRIASTENYYVSPAGSDTNPGSISEPFKTINQAVRVVQPGDTIFFRQGTYPNVDIVDVQGTAGNPIVFQAYPGEHVVFDRYAEGSGPHYVMNLRNACKYLVFDGFEITDSDPLIDELRKLDISEKGDLARLKAYKDKMSTRDGIKINHNPNKELPHHLTFKNMKIHHILGVGFFATKGHHLRFLNNHVYDLGWPRSGYGWYTNGEHHLYRGNIVHDCAYGFHIKNTDFSVFEGNTMYSNGGAFFHMSSGKVKNNGYGLRIWGGGTGNIIRNNILYDNWAGIDIVSTATRILNNTVYNNGVGIRVAKDKNATVRNNICYKNHAELLVGPGNTQDHNLVGIDPAFTDAPDHNFQLRLTSPAIDAGAPHPDVTDDFHGNPRPRGSAVDIGAYEYK